MGTVIEFIAIAAVVVFGLSFMALIGCFVYYHSKFINHVLYLRDKELDKWVDGIVFGEKAEDLFKDLDLEDFEGVDSNE